MSVQHINAFYELKCIGCSTLGYQICTSECVDAFLLSKDCIGFALAALASNWVVDTQYIEVAEHRLSSLLPSSLHFVGTGRAL